MKPILNIEDIVKLKMDEKLIECIAYRGFLRLYPRIPFALAMGVCQVKRYRHRF